MKRWTLKQALFAWAISGSLTLMVGLSGLWVWKKVQSERFSNEKYRIAAILQTGLKKEALKSGYLAELLDLSCDAKEPLYAFDLKQGEEKLLASPLIAKARLKRMPPNALYIDYEVRHPVALLGDYQNIAVDKEGYLFPISPFFSPLALPEIYLGLPPFEAPEDPLGRRGGDWRTPLKDRFFSLALEVLDFTKAMQYTEGLRVKRIDVSNAFASSLGQRELVLFTEEELSLQKEGTEVVFSFPKILRLMPKDYPEQLTHFLNLRRAMIEDYKKQVVHLPKGGKFSPRIVDLRIPQLAFVQNSD